MRNIAQISRREFDEQRWLVNGVTASVPAYKVADSAGHKEWVVDVYIGPIQGFALKDVPIVPTAKALITDIRQPVQLEKSKQGFYTVVGRAKIMTAGAQTPDGSILLPTYRELEVNLAQINALHIADLDFDGAVFQADPDQEFQADPDQEFQVITVTDAFGHPVGGADDDCTDATADSAPLVPVKRGKTRHVLIDVTTFGPWHDPYAMQWGAPGAEFQPAVYKIIELVDA